MNCKTNLFSLILITTICISTDIAYSASYSGYIITEDGNTINVVEFSDSDFVKKDAFWYKKGNTRIEIPINLVKKITATSDGGVIVTLKSGKQSVFKPWGAKFTGGSQSLNFMVIDEFTGEYQERSIHQENIQEIVLAEEFGDLKKCPKCNRTYPHSYVYCPFDAQELKFFKIE